MLYYTSICGRGEVLRALDANLRRRGFASDLVDYQGGVVATKPTTPPGTGWLSCLVAMPGGVRRTMRRVPAEFWGFGWSRLKNLSGSGNGCLAICGRLGADQSSANAFGPAPTNRFD